MVMPEIILDLDFVLGHYNYWMFVILMMTGLYVTVSRGNLIKKIVGLNLFQTSVFMLYISMGKVIGGTAPHSHRRPGHRLFEPPASRPHPDRHRGRHRHNGARARARHPHSRDLRHSRRRRYSENGA